MCGDIFKSYTYSTIYVGLLVSDFTKGVLKKRKEKKEELKWDAQMNDTKKGHEHQTVPTMYYH